MVIGGLTEYDGACDGIVHEYGMVRHGVREAGRQVVLETQRCGDARLSTAEQSKLRSPELEDDGVKSSCSQPAWSFKLLERKIGRARGIREKRQCFLSDQCNSAVSRTLFSRYRTKKEEV